ncbi:arsenate reductase family protein [Geothrix limicola]|uniref:Arsenate reductase family protein n=1 Tax=Geothrix limicola TaxID=2927978 RepID=A0ABQ5QC53_9BACT|nr:ArsC/Spx/MgsR family protein [Geothrix limicola]GLH72397.1 arsenate reductase family protein [Geothrix limicola]
MNATRSQKPVLWMKSSCTTCRNAKAKLAELGIEVEVRDYFKKPLEAAELARLLPEDPAPMLGTKSPKYKELGLKDRKLSKAEAIALMLQDNNLLKRPILVHSKGVIIGFQPEIYATLVP